MGSVTLMFVTCPFLPSSIGAHINISHERKYGPINANTKHESFNHHVIFDSPVGTRVGKVNYRILSKLYGKLQMYRYKKTKLSP
jgi:hypothetical protein